MTVRRVFSGPPTGKYANSDLAARRSTALSETYSRLGRPVANQTSSLATGQMQFVAMPLFAGQSVTKITFVSGTTAATGPTNQWFALWNAALNRVGITNDGTNGAWGANTEKQLTLTQAYLVPSDGLYYVSIMVAAGTPPTLLGVSSAVGVSGLAPVVTGRDTTHAGLTNPASAPTTATLATSAVYPYAWVS